MGVGQNPFWLLCFAVFAAVAFSLVSRPLQSGGQWSVGAVISAISLVLVVFTGQQLISLFVGTGVIVSGLVGIFIGEIRIGGRFGKPTLYTGTLGRLLSVGVVLVGCVIVASGIPDGGQVETQEAAPISGPDAG